ncbi:MAG: hypothetical protein A2513_06815 [Sulfurimonas sp. RIFOXYD12_FULL_33_39]|uniref:hypothetical protein n=1 Tax=unclassified Sulfurimonas TaxID=2623549 RepID=UPI0008C929D6|nr:MULTISPECIES: hypothetical protein [unclassified Sulfurimonas]OHE00510.1 MAG: hypothetical protein A3G74_03550 [Sulfurimonas sp. RIFCSPLOWO2_12_FULL_34_6]OHE10565.1 MAG: hypothetical protein A2513_06815 [Sulfurimonas sp. RIFOXYD12_FULL_33_39]OHE15024.1 MAG: hypothetical protein A2530_01005 [Sulfurimonas sp. RIFOXYD2_FULL_34_21]
MKIFISILFLILVTSASEQKYAIKAQILEKVFANISIGKDFIIWSDNKELLFELKKSKNFTTSINCENATMIILEDKKNLEKNCINKPIFVLEYNLLSEVSQSFGAIFWKKGRPNIIILSPRAKKLSIDISQKLNEYVEEKVW